MTQPAPGDGRILDQKYPALLGKQVTISPGVGTGTEPIVNGVHIFSRDFALLEAGGTELRDAENLTIMIDANSANNPNPPPTASRFAMQGVLDFAGGTARFGQSSHSQAPGNNPLAQQIVFDVGLGTAVVVPGAFVRLSLRYVAMSAIGFFPGSPIGPDQEVNVSLNYGDKSNLGINTKTDFPYIDLTIAGSPSNTSVNIVRDKFATDLEVTWQEYAGAGAATPVNLEFLGLWGAGSSIMKAQIAANTLPVPRLRWPAGADSVFITNGDPAFTMHQLTVRQFLSL